MDELRAPLDVDVVASAARTPEEAARIYAASLFAIDVDTAEERWKSSGGIYSCLASFSQGANMLMISRNMHRWFDQAAVLITLSHRLVLAVARLFRESRFVIHASGKLRRLGLVHFQKEYVRWQLSARQGACRQCATCCNLLFTCPMLTKRGRCLVYGTCRPQACKTFPIDQRDIDEVDLYGDRCGYNFRDTLAINTKQRGSA